MTFSARVKAELCKCPVESADTALAEICGIVLFANTFDSRSLRITTENQDFAARVSKLLKMLFGFDFDRKVIPANSVKKYSFTVDHPDKLSAIYDAFGYDMRTTHTLHLNGALVEDEASRAAFVRGAFFSGRLHDRSGAGVSLGAGHFPLSSEPGGAGALVRAGGAC